MSFPKIAFIGAGSTVFMKNIVGDVLQRPALVGSKIALMDIDPRRLEESASVANKLVATLGVPASIETHSDQRRALEGADFVVTAFQIGGYAPCTITDFEVPKRFGLRQTIADTLGVGGIMRGLRTVPHLWSVCEDMLAVCPDAILLQHVNPMAINTWAIAARYPAIRQVGLCHSVQGTAMELANDLDIPFGQIRYRAAGINHMAFYLEFEQRQSDGSYRDLYPELLQGYREGRLPKPDPLTRCPNKVRYEMLSRLGYFVTESSEHFAEYTPWFIKRGREDLIEKFGIPLDEYPKRCVEQIEGWKRLAETYRSEEKIEVRKSREYASVHRQFRLDRRALGNLRQSAQRRQHFLAARRLRRGSRLPRGRVGHSSDPSRRAAAAIDRADPHQRQRPGAHRSRPHDREPRTHLSRRDDGPAHCVRARSRSNLAPDRRVDRRAWRLAARLGAISPLSRSCGRGLG